MRATDIEQEIYSHPAALPVPNLGPSSCLIELGKARTSTNFLMREMVPAVLGEVAKAGAAASCNGPTAAFACTVKRAHKRRVRSVSSRAGPRRAWMAGVPS